MAKLEFTKDIEGNEVRIGDEIIACINLWRGRDEAARGIVVSISAQMCTAEFPNRGQKRVKNSKFIKTIKDIK